MELGRKPATRATNMLPAAIGYSSTMLVNADVLRVSRLSRFLGNWGFRTKNVQSQPALVGRHLFTPILTVDVEVDAHVKRVLFDRGALSGGLCQTNLMRTE